MYRKRRREEEAEEKKQETGADGNSYEVKQEERTAGREEDGNMSTYEERKNQTCVHMSRMRMCVCACMVAYSKSHPMQLIYKTPIFIFERGERGCMEGGGGNERAARKGVGVKERREQRLAPEREKNLEEDP